MIISIGFETFLEVMVTLSIFLEKSAFISAPFLFYNAGPEYIISPLDLPHRKFQME